jgi:hypothetical protein
MSDRGELQKARGDCSSDTYFKVREYGRPIPVNTPVGPAGGTRAGSVAEVLVFGFEEAEIEIS